MIKQDRQDRNRIAKISIENREELNGMEEKKN